MIWVLVFGGIAVAGLIMLVAYAIWLAHKASDVFAEVKVLGKRADEFLQITSQIEVPESAQDSERVQSVKAARLQPVKAKRARRST